MNDILEAPRRALSVQAPPSTEIEADPFRDGARDRKEGLGIEDKVLPIHTDEQYVAGWKAGFSGAGTLPNEGPVVPHDERLWSAQNPVFDCDNFPAPLVDEKTLAELTPSRISPPPLLEVNPILRFLQTMRRAS